MWNQEIDFAKNAGFIRPTEGDVHVDRSLTNIAIAFLQNADNFVARRVFPTVPVTNKSDSYFTIDRGNFNRNQVKRRQPGTPAARINWTTSTDNYNSERRSIANPVPDEIRANADSALMVDRVATELVTHQGLIEQEVDWVNTYFTGGQLPGVTWTFVADGVAASPTPSTTFDPTSTDTTLNNIYHWSDGANSTPIEDITLAGDIMEEETGKRPNVFTCGRKVFSILKNHPDLVGRLDRGQTSGTATVTREAMAGLFEVDEILITSAIQNTAAEGLANSHSFIGGKHALLSYRPQTPAIMVPSAGYNFTWTGFIGSTTNGMRIRRKRDDMADTDVFELDMHYDNKLVSADLGYFFNGIVA